MTGTSRMSIGPEDNPWYPRDDGNYTSWEEMFAKQIGKYCSDKASFEFNVRSGPTEPSLGLFEALYSGSGAKAMRDALADDRMLGYVGTKGGNIALLVIGVLIFLTAIVLAFALFPKMRAAISRCTGGNACRDRPRQSPVSKSGFGWLLLTYKVVAGLSLICMLALSIVVFVYAGKLHKGTNALACDFWQSMRGHYFGAQGVTPPADVLTNWSGTVPQWKMMQEMAGATNPTAPGGCPLCQKIQAEFAGPGGFIQRVNENVDKVKIDVLGAAYLVKAVTTALETYTAPKLTATTNQIEVDFPEGKITLGLGNVGPEMLTTYITDLKQATQDGIEMFEENLKEQLSPDSPVLRKGYETAKTGSDALNDVNYIIAKIIVLWDSKVWPTARGALLAVTIIACILGSLALIWSVGALVLMWKLQKNTSHDRPASPKVTKLLGGAYAALVIFAGFCAFGASVLFFAGSVGRDTCEFLDETVYENGEWRIFPDVLIHESASNKTAMATVLNTCVKESGDGDVAGALGLRMMMRSLERDIAGTRADGLIKVDKRLDLSFKERKVETLRQLTENSARLVRFYRHTVSYKNPELGDAVEPSYVPSKDGMTLMSFSAEQKHKIPTICAINSLFGEADLVATLRAVSDCLNGVYYTAAPVKDIYDALAELVKESNSEIGGFCGAALQDLGFCKLDVEDKLVLDVGTGKRNNEQVGGFLGFGAHTKTSLENNVLDTPEMMTFLKGLNKDATKIQQAISFVAFLTQFERLMAHDMKDIYNANIKNPGYRGNVTGSQVETILWPAHNVSEMDTQTAANVKMNKVLEFALSDLNGVCRFTPVAAATPKTTSPDSEESVARMLGGEKELFTPVDEEAMSFLPNPFDPFMTADDLKLGNSSTAPRDPSALCTYGQLMKSLAKTADISGKTLQDGFKVANDEVMNFLLNTTVGKFEQMVGSSYTALDNFDCQYIGQSLRQGVAAGLCESLMPSTASLAVLSLLLFVLSGVCAIIVWRSYHYYLDLATFDSSALRLKLASMDDSDNGAAVQDRQPETTDTTPMQTTRRRRI